VCTSKCIALILPHDKFRGKVNKEINASSILEPATKGKSAFF